MAARASKRADSKDALLGDTSMNTLSRFQSRYSRIGRRLSSAASMSPCARRKPLRCVISTLWRKRQSCAVTETLKCAGSPCRKPGDHSTISSSMRRPCASCRMRADASAPTPNRGTRRRRDHRAAMPLCIWQYPQMPNTGVGHKPENLALGAALARHRQQRVQFSREHARAASNQQSTIRKENPDETAWLFDKNRRRVLPFPMSTTQCSQEGC